MHFHWRSWKSKGFIFYLHNHVISLNSIHTTPKIGHAYFGPKSHLLTKYHIGSAYIIHCIWPLLALYLHEGHSHPKLASAALPTRFGQCLDIDVCGATVALIRQPQTHLHNEEPETRNRILWEGVRFLLYYIFTFIF